MTTGYFILTRTVHFAACLLFFGVFAFDRFVAARILANRKIESTDYWNSRLRLFSLILLPIILISGAAWFVLVAMTMSGQPPQLGVLKMVWAQTHFGTVWKIRLMIGLAAVAGAAVSKPPSAFHKSMGWVQLCLGGALLGSLAWAGHGQEDSRWHLLADIVHLLMAGLWPAGLLPFAMLLRKLRRASEPAITTLVRRFSALSLVGVSMLTVTGLVNSWFLVGSFSNLFDQTYGHWLLAKIALVGVAVAIGAVNLLRLKPRLSVEPFPSPSAQATAAQLEFNVHSELFLGMAIVVVVAVLGMLPPANHQHFGQSAADPLPPIHAPDAVF